MMVGKAKATFVTLLIMAMLGGCGSNSGTGESNEPEEALPDLSSEEQAYLDERIGINDEANALANEQLDLFEDCTACMRSEKEDNWYRMNELRRDGQDLVPPSGYEESNDIWLSKMENLEGQMALGTTDPVIKEATFDQIYDLIDEGNAYADESRQALPSAAQDYYGDS